MKLPTSVMAALRSHCEAMELEADVKRWDHEQRRLVCVTSRTRWGTLRSRDPEGTYGHLQREATSSGWISIRCWDVQPRPPASTRTPA